MHRRKVYRTSLLVVVTLLVIFSVGCGTQPHVSNDNTSVHSTPTPIPTLIPLDLDSPAGAAQAIAGDPMVGGLADRFGPNHSTRLRWSGIRMGALGRNSRIAITGWSRRAMRLADVSASLISIMCARSMSCRTAVWASSSQKTRTPTRRFPGWGQRPPSSGYRSFAALLQPQASRPV